MGITIKIPVSTGELVDKITILEIKCKKIKETEKLRLINHELKLLSGELIKLLNNYSKSIDEYTSLKNKLHRVNLKLWKIEDDIRELEAYKDFGKKFIELARSVYLNNDKRSQIKNRINKLFQSQIQDVKSYTPYKR